MVKNVALKYSSLDRSAEPLITRETRPSRFPEDTAPSTASRTIHSESLVTSSMSLETVGFTGSHFRLGDGRVNMLADREGGGRGGGDTTLSTFIGVVWDRSGVERMARGTVRWRKGVLLLGGPTSDGSSFTLEDALGVVSGVVWGVMWGVVLGIVWDLL